MKAIRGFQGLENVVREDIRKNIDDVITEISYDIALELRKCIENEEPTITVFKERSTPGEMKILGHRFSINPFYIHYGAMVRMGLAEDGIGVSPCIAVPLYMLTKKAEKLYEQLKREGFYERKRGTL